MKGMARPIAGRQAKLGDERLGWCAECTRVYMEAEEDAPAPPPVQAPSLTEQLVKTLKRHQMREI